MTANTVFRGIEIDAAGNRICVHEECGNTVPDDQGSDYCGACILRDTPEIHERAQVMVDWWLRGLTEGGHPAPHAWEIEETFDAALEKCVEDQLQRVERVAIRCTVCAGKGRYYRDSWRQNEKCATCEGTGEIDPDSFPWFNPNMSDATVQALAAHYTGFSDRVIRQNGRLATADRRRIYGFSKANRERYGHDSGRFTMTLYGDGAVHREFQPKAALKALDAFEALGVYDAVTIMEGA